MVIIKALTFLAFVNICVGFERDENYLYSGNETIVETFLKTMELSDYKMPSVDHLG